MIEKWAVKTSQPDIAIMSTSDYLIFIEIINITLRDLGIEAHPESRLVRYEKLVVNRFRSRFTKDELNRDAYFILARAFSEIRQLAYIASYFRISNKHQGLIEKARILLHDSALPSIDRTKSTPGRDAQFELFVAACWSACGFNCKLRDPPGPDLGLEIFGFYIGLEVKRIKSLSSLEKRVDKANKQNSTLPGGGAIVTDLSPVILNSLPYLRALSHKDVLQDLEGRLKNIMSTQHDKIEKRVRVNSTFGWIGYCEALYLTEDSPLFYAYQWKNFGSLGFRMVNGSS